MGITQSELDLARNRAWCKWILGLPIWTQRQVLRDELRLYDAWMKNELSFDEIEEQLGLLYTTA